MTLDDLVEELCVTLLQECHTHIKFGRLSIRQEFKLQATPVLEHAMPTVSELEGMKIPLTVHDSIDRWTAEGNIEREPPYGGISSEMMKRAIREGDIELIDESPVCANVALFDMRDENGDLPEGLDLDVVDYIESQRSQPPQYLGREDQLAQKKAFLSMF